MWKSSLLSFLSDSTRADRRDLPDSRHGIARKRARATCAILGARRFCIDLVSILDLVGRRGHRTECPFPSEVWCGSNTLSPTIWEGVACWANACGAGIVKRPRRSRPPINEKQTISTSSVGIHLEADPRRKRPAAKTRWCRSRVDGAAHRLAQQAVALSVNVIAHRLCIAVGSQRPPLSGSENMNREPPSVVCISRGLCSRPRRPNRQAILGKTRSHADAGPATDAGINTHELLSAVLVGEDVADDSGRVASNFQSSLPFAGSTAFTQPSSVP